MPPPKKTAKKAVKKAAGHHHGKHHEAKDLRRAYEHIGRVEVLHASLDFPALEGVDALTKLAEDELENGFNKSAAELLRASEHLSFAVLSDDRSSGGDVSTALEGAIKEQFDELLQRAKDHWEDFEKRSSVLAVLYKSSRKNAEHTLRNGAYRRALEFARAAEALSHARQDDQRKLGLGFKKLQLEGA
ncbi:hypothetical protein [Granulicella sp. dw_53]|uniref:hypothetical protein n=1 Tax=Granulicella sp. dw_53 TaxID=2719792 RepID=UPI001BD1C93E|nr:hypothetical protein [Granulicella sp. dw_53]